MNTPFFFRKTPPPFTRSPVAAPQFRRRPRLAVLLSATIASLFSPQIHAAQFLWDGGGANDNWSTALNWLNDVAPTTASNDYGFTGSVRLTPSADGGTPWVVNSLSFMPGASAFTLSSTTTLNLGATGIVNRSTANQSISAPIALQAASVISAANSGSLTLTGIVSGAFGFQKTGVGNLTLSNSNTYIGVTTINTGTIILGAAGGATNTPLGTAAGATNIVGTGAALELNGFTLGTAEPITLRGTGVNGTGALTNSTGSVTYSGVTTLGNNTATNGAAIGGAGNITLSAGITGDFNLNKVGAGILTLNGNSTRAAGITTLEAGTLKLGAVAALGTTATTLVLNSGTLDLATNTTVNAYNTTVTGNSTITTERATAGAGVTQTLGTLGINGSTLTVNTTGNATSGTSGLTFGATTFTGNTTFNVVNGATATTTLTLGALNDTGAPRSLTKTGNGTLTLGSAATSLVNGNSITVSGGTLNSNNATALGALANVTVSGTGSTLALGAAQTIGALNGAGSGTVSLGANRTLTIGSVTNNLDSNFTGTITGTGTSGLTKAGSGTLTLAGNNTNTGTTTVSLGTLKLGSAGDATNTPLGTTAAGTTISAGGALDLNGFTLGTAEALTLNGGGVRSGGALTNTGAAATYSGAVTQASASTIGGTGNITLTGLLTGAFDFTKQGTNTLSVATTATGNSSVNTVTINRGTLHVGSSSTVNTLITANGFFLNPSGTLTVDNTLASNTNRIQVTGATAPLTVAGGTFNYVHGGTAATNYSEQLGSGGALVLNSGGINFNLSQAAVGQTSTVTASAITRNTGATALFSGTGLGVDTRNRFTMTTAPALTNSILPWAVITNDGGATYNLVTHGGNGTSVAALGTYLTTAETGWVAASNARPSSTANATLSAARSVNALVLDNGINLALSAANTDRILTFTSGALLQTGGSSTISNNGTGEVTLAFGATQGIITTMGNLTLQRGDGSASGITGSAGIVKTGPGTFTNNATNANTGALVINDGTFRAVTQPGSVSAGGVTGNKGTLELASDASTTFTNTNTTLNGDFTLKPDRATSGSGAGLTQTLGTLALNNTGATLTVTAGSNVTTAPITLATGAVTLGANDNTINTSGTLTALTLASITGAGNNLTITGDGNTTVTGAITTTTGTLIKNGTGNLTLNGTSTFTGLTTLNTGTLTLGHATDTFAGSAPVRISGGTLAVGTNSDTLGAVTLQSGSITGTTGVLSPSSLEVQSGTLSAIIGGSGALTKTTAGTVIVTSANTYTGNTTIQTGTLQIGNGGTTGSLAAGSAIINNSALTFNRSDSLTVSNTISGNGLITQAGTGTVVLSGTNTAFAGPAAVNSGATLILSNASALGTTNTAGTTVASGGTLRLDTGATPSNGRLTIGGTGVGGSGALIGVGTVATRWAGDITLTANTLVTNTGTGLTGTLALGTTSPITGNFRGTDLAQTPVDLHTLSLGANTLTFNGNIGATGTIFINARVTGTGGLTIDMNNATDDVRLGALMNTYTGTTLIKGGTLTLRSITANGYIGDPTNVGFYGINGPVVIGDGLGAANTAILNTGAGGTRQNQINFTTDVTVNSDGLWTLTSLQDINSVTMTSGTIDLGASAGSLYLGGNVTTNANATEALISGSGTSTLSLTSLQGGPVTLPNSTRTFTVADGAAASDLTLNVPLKNGSFVKAGLGTMTIMNDNSGGYEGTTTVNLGILNIRNGNSLGQGTNIDSNATTVNGTGTTNALGVTVGTGAANGTLQLQGTGAVATEKLTLNGMGYLNTGALQNVSGDNTWTGQIVLGSASRIQSDLNTLTITPVAGISGTNTDLDVRGAGNTTITTVINTGTGVLTKEGTGTLTLNGSGASTYSGTTTIFNGVISLQTPGGLGGTTSGTIVNSGAALQLSNATYGGSLVTLAEPLTINGTGNGGATGALRNVVGNNTYSGPITVGAADSRINSDSGTTLLQTGTLTSPNLALVIGGAGNTTQSNTMSLGTGALTKDGAGTLTFSGSVGGTGQIHLLAGNMAVGGTSILNSKEFDSSLGTTLTIASNGLLAANYTTTTAVVSGQVTGAGTFQAFGTGKVTFDQTINSPSLIVTLGGGGGQSVGTGLTPLTFSIINNAHLTFATLNITGDTILDFGNSSASFLTSANLNISANVLITVQNWISLVDAWYVTSAINSGAGVLDRTAGTPENQITFTGFSNNSTSWINQYTYGDFRQNEIRPVPEPSTYGAIFVSGCLALIGYRRYRRRSPAKAS